MLKHFFITLAGFSVLGLPAVSQDAGEIAKVQSGQSCPGCNLFQADLSYLDADNVDVSGARLRQSDMQLATFDNWSFKGTNLSIANLFGARFNRCDFTGANLQRATLVGTYFGSSTLKDADLAGANLSGADLSIAKGLTQPQLDSACGDESTQLPEKLSIPTCQ